MTTLRAKPVRIEVVYPTTDGKPMAETPLHRQVMTDEIEMLDFWFQDDPQVYVSGNMMVYYEEGNPRKWLSPDVFVTKGVDKTALRDVYLIWQEKHAPQVVTEITSRKTAKEDRNKKFHIYREVWKVKEYFLFDPRAEYLKPPLQGYRLRGNRYLPIKEVDGRLPSEVLGLHLEADGQRLRLYDPKTGQYLQTAREKNAEAEAARQQAEIARQQAEAEVEQLRRELEALRKQPRKS